MDLGVVAIMKFEVFSSLDEFAALRDEIEAHLKNFPESFFYSPGWLIPFQKVFGTGMEFRHVIGRDPQGKMTGSAHLSIVRTPFLRVLRQRVVALMGTRAAVSPEHLDLPIRPEAWDQWFDFLEKQIAGDMGRCAFALFDSVAEHAPFIEAWTARLRDRGFRVVREEQDVCPYFDLPESYQALLDGYSANMRKITRRTLRRAGDQVRMADHTEIGDVETVLSEARRLHTLSRGKKGDAGSLGRSGYMEFHRELIRSLSHGDALYMKFLVSAGTPIAYRHGFLVDGVYYDYQTGYDPAHERLRPGFVILALVVEDLIRRGVRRFDFLRGDEPYKRHWASKDRRSYRYLIFPPRLRSWLYLSLRRLYHGLW